ncbi:MAG: ecdysteroid 22-kinase family protein [Acidimicrobiia bacterium]|nr:ecdysteroid 22-kinase family protein [Acidimicrobiia bacterium]
MNHVPLVATPGDVTPEWLTGALVGSGAAPRGARVVGLSSETVGNGKIGENVRFVLDWSGPSDGAPSTVVGKFASPDPTSRQAGIMTGNYLKEVLFYRELATTVAIRAPRCHAAEIDTETGEFVLLLEDLAPCETGDQIRGCTVDQAALAIEELPRLHAPAGRIQRSSTSSGSRPAARRARRCSRASTRCCSPGSPSATATGSPTRRSR